MDSNDDDDELEGEDSESQHSGYVFHNNYNDNASYSESDDNDGSNKSAVNSNSETGSNNSSEDDNGTFKDPNYFSNLKDVYSRNNLLYTCQGLRHEKPVTKSPVLLWDLRMVLDTLKQKLFEPFFTVDLKFSDVQNNVLLAFASGRRASEIHALVFKSIKWLEKDGQVFLTMSPLDQLLEMRTQGEFSDVNIIVQGKHFPCHRTILSAVSPYFRAMFNSGMKEQHNKEVPMEGIDKVIFEKVINYIYTGEVDLADETVQPLCEAADMFQIDALKQGCARFLQKQMTPTNCLSTWKMAVAHCMEKLAKSAFEFALENFADVKHSDNFFAMSEKELCSYVSHHALDGGEEEWICDAALEWLDHKSVERVSSCMNVFATLRVLDLDPVYIRTWVLKSCTIQLSQEAKDYLEALLDHMVYDLPRPTKFPPLTPRTRTYYRNEMVVLGGEINSGNVTSEAYFLYCDDGQVHQSDEFEMESRKAYSPCYEVDRKHSVLPDGYNLRMACCTMGGNIFISGYGKNMRDVWRYEVRTSTWQTYGCLLMSRQAHCMVAGNKKHLYVLGGYRKKSRKYKVHKSVEDINPDTGNEVLGDLKFRIYAFGAVFYLGNLYTFGGKTMRYYRSSGANTSTDVIQSFDTNTRQCTVLDTCLPKPQSGIQSILYGDWIIILGDSAILLAKMDAINKATSQKDEDKDGDKDKTKIDDNGNKSDNVDNSKGVSSGVSDATHKNVISPSSEGTSDNVKSNTSSGACKRDISPNPDATPSKRVLRRRKANQNSSDNVNNSQEPGSAVPGPQSAAGDGFEATVAKTFIKSNCQAGTSGSNTSVNRRKNTTNSQTANDTVKTDNIVSSNLGVDENSSSAFVIKSGVGKEEFGAVLLGDNIYILGGRERLPKGLFDYSACICSVALTSILDSETTKLEWRTVGSLKYYMSVFMTAQLSIYRPQNDAEDNNSYDGESGTAGSDDEDHDDDNRRRNTDSDSDDY